MAQQTINLSASITKALDRIAAKMDGGTVEIGFFEGDIEPGGVPVASAAFWNEFGHGGQFPAPARPFFRPMVSACSSAWPKAMGETAKGLDYDGAAVLGQMGELIASQLQDSIKNAPVAPLSPTTLMLRKKFGNHPENIRARDVIQAQHDVAAGKAGATGTQAKPLMWTGDMFRFVGYRVSNGAVVHITKGEG